MDTDSAHPANPDALRLVGMGLVHIEWARGLLARIEGSPESKTQAYQDRVGVIRNEQDVNVYHFMVTRSLYTATRCMQAVAPLQDAHIGSLPTEILFRSALTASAKALFLLMPEKQTKRESRMHQVYLSDRSSLNHATNAELRLVGEPEVTPSGGRKKTGLDDSQIIREVLDDLVAMGSCPCGRDDCPKDDLKPFRHRVLRLWWLYSSVTHVNLWHLEKAATVSQSGESVTTGDFNSALYDLSWLYSHAVTYYARRYDVLKERELLNLSAMLNHMRNADLRSGE